MILLNLLESIIRWVGGAMALAVFGLAVLRILLNRSRRRGTAAGRVPAFTRAAWFYLVATLVFVGVIVLLWRPVPLQFSPGLRIALLGCGGCIYSGGLALYAWGMASLGRMFAGSTSLGAELYADHRLITGGPYRLVRHPMYLGVILAAWGGLLLYQTWAMLLLSLGFLWLPLRARREEQALSAQFGAEWSDYCQRTPAWFPQFRPPRA